MCRFQYKNFVLLKLQRQLVMLLYIHQHRIRFNFITVGTLARRARRAGRAQFLQCYPLLDTCIFNHNWISFVFIVTFLRLH